MAVVGAHVLLYAPEAERLRETLRDVRDDLAGTIAELREKGVNFEREPVEESFGTWIRMRLPGGVEVPLDEPEHPLAIDI